MDTHVPKSSTPIRDDPSFYLNASAHSLRELKELEERPLSKTSSVDSAADILSHSISRRFPYPLESKPCVKRERVVWCGKELVFLIVTEENFEQTFLSYIKDLFQTKYDQSHQQRQMLEVIHLKQAEVWQHSPLLT